MDAADYFWLALFGTGILFEIGAAILKPKWTLSRHFWDWFAIGKNWKEDLAGYRWFILLGLIASVGLHFLVQSSWVPVLVFSVLAAWSVYYHYRYEVER